jgi:hypothetical protein
MARLDIFSVPNRVALVVYSELEGSGRSAIFRSLMFAQELELYGDDVCVVFDGAGTTAAAAMLDDKHPFHSAFISVRHRFSGVCASCAESYGVRDVLEKAGLQMLIDDRGHASLRRLLIEGRQIVSV